MRILVVIGVLVVVGLIVLRTSVYIVDVTEQALILRFGEVRDTRLEPGIYLKTPLVENVVRFDKRVLRIDAPPVAMPDKDKQNLVIDSYARYRITSPEAFFRTLQTEDNARSRLADIITAALRAEVALKDRSEIIGGRVFDDAGARLVDEQGNPRVGATESRSEILNNVLASVRRTIAAAEEPFGIEMIDVRIKRADFPDSVTPTIYTRMRAERNRIAAEERALGDQRDLEIRAVANRQRDVILAEADRTSSQVRGDGEAQAIGILAQALNRDPEFFSFQRSLEAYQTFLNQRTTVILSSEADIFQFLQSPLERIPAGASR